MSTTNLGLDMIQTTDSIQNAFLTKMNSNMQKLDNAYGLLKTKILDVTEENNLNDAINTFNAMVTQVANLTSENNTLKATGNATASDIMTGKTALVQGQQVTGNIVNMGSNAYVATGSVSGDNYRLAIPRSGYYSGGYLSRAKANVLSDLGVTAIPTINVTLTGSNSSYISGYGAGIDQNGVLVIWAMSSSSAYEHIYFVDTSIGAGTIGNGWNISSYDTGDPANVPHACTVTGLSGKSIINITLNAYNTNTSSDYIQVRVTLTAS